MRAEGELEVGASVGRYVLLRPAEASKRALSFIAWDPELDRNVFLKLVRVRADDREYERERILHEAQALARLAHPNVVVVYDVGTWGDRVYMATEHVDGDTLVQWLAAERRTWPQIRDVIAQAGRGLAAAHAAEIVHLDVEPSNIVVGSDGLVRVLEFGLAQRLRSPLSLDSSADGSVDSARTAPSPVHGSPAYVAAERHRGEDPDARADQFALCVTAWEAFYGRLPFAGESRREVRGNVVRGRIADPPTSDVPARIEAALRRGLDPNPGKRWPDIAALLDELDRDPARHRKRIVVAGVAVAVLGIASWAWMRRNDAQAALCKGGEQKLAGIWDAATRESTRRALEATGVDYADATWLGVQPVLDAYANAWVAMYTDACEATRLRGEQSEGLLDRRMMCLEQRRHELRALVGVFAEADASVVERAVSASTGLESLEPCADVERLMATSPPVDAAARARHEELRQMLAQSRALERAGRIEDGGAMADRALALALELDAKPEAAALHLVLATVAEAHGDVDASLEHIDESVLLSELAAADVERLNAYTQLAWTLGHLKADFPSGHLLVRMGLALVDRLGGGAIERARLLSHEAVLAIDEGKYREAIDLGQRAVDLIEELDGDYGELAVVYNNIAAAHHMLAEPEDALRYYDLARETRMRMLGESHPEVAEVVANAASVKHSLGRLEEAEADFRRAIAILDAGPGPREVFMRNLHNNFAILLQDLERYDESVSYYERAIEGWRKVDAKQPLIGVGLSNIADLELQRGRPVDAEKYAEEALALFETGLDSNHRYVGYAAATLGRARLGAGRPKDALPLLRRGVAILGTSDTDDYALVQVQLALAEAILATGGDADEATMLANSAESRIADLDDSKQRTRGTAALENVRALLSTQR